LSLTTEQPRQAAPPVPPLPGAGNVFPKVMVRTLLETVRVPEKETTEQQNERMDAAVIALMSIDTSTSTDLMYAAHAVASHHATMECVRRAMLSVGNSDVTVRLHKSAVSLSRMMAANLDTVENRRAQRNRGGKTP
jgi:hypothetical protein